MSAIDPTLELDAELDSRLDAKPLRARRHFPPPSVVFAIFVLVVVTVCAVAGAQLCRRPAVTTCLGRMI
jgi:hypothetical protein